MFSTPYDSILFVITCITMVIQFYTIGLIHFKKINSMAEYRYFLNFFTISDMIFTVAIGLFIEPFPITPLVGSACRGLASYFGGGSQSAMITASIAIGYAACVLGAQDYCLVYRFAVIYQNRKFYNFLMHPHIKILALLGIHVFAAGCGFFFYLMLMQPEEANKYLINNWRNLSEPESLIPGEPIIMVDTSNILSRICIALTVLGLGLSEAFCAVMCILILSILRKSSDKFSRTTYRLHMQFTLLLTIQFITPLFLIVAPAAIYIIFFILLKFQSKRLLSQTSFTLLTVYGATNAIFTLIFVSPYRKFTYQHLIRPFVQAFVAVLRKTPFMPQNSATVSAIYTDWQQSPSVLTVPSHTQPSQAYSLA